jgi:3-hydroxyacyl-CoA dehydrogenase
VGNTVNFIANRIGSFFGATIGKITIEGEYWSQRSDTLTGPLIGLSNAPLRLLDVG